MPATSSLLVAGLGLGLVAAAAGAPPLTAPASPAPPVVAGESPPLALRYKYTPGEALLYDADLTVNEGSFTPQSSLIQAHATFRITESVKSIDAAGNATLSYQVGDQRGSDLILGGIRSKTSKAIVERGAFVVSPLGKLISYSITHTPGEDDDGSDGSSGKHVVELLYSSQGVGGCWAVPSRTVSLGEVWRDAEPLPPTGSRSRLYTKSRLAGFASGIAEITRKVHSDASSPPPALFGAAESMDENGRTLFNTNTGTLESLQSSARIAGGFSNSDSAGVAPAASLLRFTMTLTLRRVGS